MRCYGDGGHVGVNALSGSQAGKELASAKLAMDISIVVVVKQPSGIFSKLEGGKGCKGGVTTGRVEREHGGAACGVRDVGNGVGGINAFTKGCLTGREFGE